MASSSSFTRRFASLVMRCLMRGSPGEGDLPQMGNVEATMVGVGDAYLHGARMPAAQALAQAGLQPLKPFGADELRAVIDQLRSVVPGQA